MRLLALPRYLSPSQNAFFFIPAILSLSLSASFAWAQDAVQEQQVEAKSLRAARVNSAPLLDGKLDDAVWQ